MKGYQHWKDIREKQVSEYKKTVRIKHERYFFRAEFHSLKECILCQDSSPQSIDMIIDCLQYSKDFCLEHENLILANGKAILLDNCQILSAIFRKCSEWEEISYSLLRRIISLFFSLLCEEGLKYQS